MFCDMETGICGTPGEEAIEMIDFNKPTKTVDLYYVTDPICSHCWAIEPQLRRFFEQYGDYFNVHTVMGGLLEKWDGGFADVQNGITGPADVAGHWREVGEQTHMPIDGSLWYDNPVESSYPPSRVFKVVQKYDEKLAVVFLRRAREAVFVFNENIADERILTNLVNGIGLDGKEILKEAELPASQQLLNEDFQLAGSLGVRGFPTIIMVNKEKKGAKIVGGRPLEFYVSGLQQVLGTEELYPKQQPALFNLLAKEKLLFSKEIEVMYDIEQKDIQTFIEKELSADDYESKEILGEIYFLKK